MNERLFDAVEVCLAALKTGVDMGTCLALYPDLAGDLRPILEASLAARELSRIQQPPAAVENRSRARFLTAAAAMDIKSKPKYSWAAIRRVALVALVLLVAFAVSWNGLLVASAKSLPGDMLYPVKRVSERVNLRLIPNQEETHQYESNFNHRRAEELQLLLELGRVEHVSYEGTVTEITPDRWVVGGFTVAITPDTTFVGEPKVGQFVEVEGQSQLGGWVNAHEIHLRYFRYAGEVEQIEQNYWIISGKRLDLSYDVQIDPGLHLYDQALVLVQSNDDGKHSALAIMGVPDALQFNSQGSEMILEGQVEEISNSVWTVAGRIIRIAPQTLIAANISIGDLVKVHAFLNWDVSLTATRIELLLTSQSIPFVQPEQKFQDPGAELFSDKSGEYNLDVQDGSALDQAEGEDDGLGSGQNAEIEDNHESSTQVESSDDHEEADHHDDSDDKHKEDDHKDDGDSSSDQHEDSPEIDD